MLFTTQILLIADESILSDTQYLNILVGILETPHAIYLYDCQPLKCASHSNIIARAVDDAVKNLGINKNFFCLLLSDAAKYLIVAGITLKSLYSKLLHVTCVEHLLHNCAMKIKSHFENAWINLKNIGSNWIFRKHKIFKISKHVLSATQF